MRVYIPYGRSSIRAWALLCAGALALLLGMAPPARAESEPPVLLLPTTPRAFVELAALIVDVTVHCPEANCSLEIEQVYHLQNRDRLKGAQIGVGIQGSETQPVAVAFSPENRATATGPGVWTLRYDAESTIVARLRYSLPLESASLARWAWQPDGLIAWGRMTSARVELHLPWPAPEDLFLAVEPPAAGFDGRTVHWEYQEPAALGPFQVWLVTPPLWAQAEALRRESQRLALARLYRDLGGEAARLGAPYPDPFFRVLGELQAAVEQDPSPAPRLALAELYLERAAGMPELEYNYRLLAAEALEAALQAGAQDASVSRKLAELYFALAQQARQNGNPTEALQYIGLARDHAPDGAIGDAATIEEMTLEWALDLASKGRVSEALVQAADVLSPRMQDALYRYAPTIIAARTEVSLTAETRAASYRLYLYPPLAQKTLQRLTALASALDAIPAARANMAQGAAEGTIWADLTFEVDYAHGDEVARLSQQIANLAGAEPDLIHVLIATPWAAGPTEFGVWRTPWLDQYAYRETPSFGALSALRDEQAQYTVWRLVEVAGGQPGSERDRLEQQLTALALREQRQIWENLSSASYWSYHVRFEEPSALPTMSWLVGWGQERTLEIMHRHYWWRRIAEDGGLALGALTALLVLIAGARALVRRLRSRPASGQSNR